MIKSSIKYHGEVIFSTGKKKLRQHNSGTTEFFDLIAKFLARYTINVNELPSKIMLYELIENKSTSSYDLGSACLIQYVYPTASFRYVNGTPCAIFTGAITDSNLKTSSASVQKYRLKILDNTSANRELAYIDIDAENITKITKGRQGLIEWRMYIANEDESSNTSDSNTSDTNNSSNSVQITDQSK